MAELKKKATRESYGEALAELGDKYDNLYVFDADLAAATKTGIFKKKFPDRFFDCGIAESNMMGVAAGMAATGKIPFASTFAMFAAGRAFEQVRNSIGYPHLNVKIGATHAGISVGEDGATHQCNEDIALMRTIPGMVVTGLMVYEAIEAAKTLASEGIEATVINIHTIKPIDEDIIVEAAKNTGLLLTVEEHSVIGGLGSAVADVLAARHPAKLVKIGVNDEFGHSGPAVDLLKEYGLCADNIVAKARDAVKAK